MRANAPAGVSAKLDDDTPVSEEMSPILMVLFVMPVSLEVRAPPLEPAAPVVPDVPPAAPVVPDVPAVVAVDVPLDELLQAETASAATTATVKANRCLRFNLHPQGAQGTRLRTTLLSTRSTSLPDGFLRLQ